MAKKIIRMIIDPKDGVNISKQEHTLYDVDTVRVLWIPMFIGSARCIVLRRLNSSTFDVEVQL